MSMEPQVSEATGKSTFTVLNRYTDQWGKERARVQGSYNTSDMFVLKPHEGCEYRGEKLMTHGAWADHIYCTGCNYSVYYPLGD